MKRSTLVLILCVLAAVVPWIHGDSSTSITEATTRAAFPGWNAAPLPPGLRPQGLGPTEERFARQFPGQLAVFGERNRTWIARWVTQPTRKLHPASDCLRAAGYAVKPGPAYVDPEGQLWATCVATRNRDVLYVRERIFGPAGTGWSDVSAWYWHALLGQNQGPWWAITEIEARQRLK